MSGAWIFICGPSGAGKDSVIAAARQALSTRTDIVFARRMVTRAVQAGSEHDPVTEPQFHALIAAGALRWRWQAHGFYYGIAEQYTAEVLAGRLVVVNGSRGHVSGLPASPDVRRVQITADPHQLATRLAQRCRDPADAILERLARNAQFSGMETDCVIVNNAELAVAAQRLADYLTA